MVGGRCTGALSISRVRDLNSIPDESSLTYEGIINENDFQIESQTDQVFDCEISQAETINPINNKRELWLGFLTKSVYDGIGLREPIDIVICLDVSGSMSMIIRNKQLKTRIDLAIEATIKLLDRLNEKIISR